MQLIPLYKYGTNKIENKWESISALPILNTNIKINNYLWVFDFGAIRCLFQEVFILCHLKNSNNLSSLLDSTTLDEDNCYVERRPHDILAWLESSTTKEETSLYPFVNLAEGKSDNLI